MRRSKKIPKLPGSEKSRNRAKKLSCEKIAPGMWRVWGGEAEHIVKINPEGVMTCDCRTPDIIEFCSHKIRVGLQIRPDIFIREDRVRAK